MNRREPISVLADTAAARAPDQPEVVRALLKKIAELNLQLPPEGRTTNPKRTDCVPEPGQSSGAGFQPVLAGILPARGSGAGSPSGGLEACPT